MNNFKVEIEKYSLLWHFDLLKWGSCSPYVKSENLSFITEQENWENFHYLGNELTLMLNFAFLEQIETKFKINKDSYENYKIITENNLNSSNNKGYNADFKLINLFTR